MVMVSKLPTKRIHLCDPEIVWLMNVLDSARPEDIGDAVHHIPGQPHERLADTYIGAKIYHELESALMEGRPSPIGEINEPIE
jgi:hypothetical protein